MKPKYRRVLLKLSGEALLPDGESHGVSIESAGRMAEEIKPLTEKGVETALVIGGGNIFRGAAAAALGHISRAQADTMGMLSTVINGLAMQEALEKLGLRANLMTSIAMQNVAEPFARQTALSHIKNGSIVIFAGGTGNPFFSTDTAASLRALEIGAEVILKGTKVDGVYSSDPKKDCEAVRYEKLTYLEVLKNRLKVMDAAAVSMCMEHKLPIVVFNVFERGNLKKAVMGENIGTVLYG